MIFLAVQPSFANTSIEVPQSVMATFQKLYPKALEVSWDNYENEFIAYFENEGNYSEATFHATGKWLETNTSLEEDQLPETIMDYIVQNFENEVEYYFNLTFTERPNEVRYYVSFSTENSKVYLIFDGEGTILETEIEEN